MEGYTFESSLFSLHVEFTVRWNSARISNMKRQNMRGKFGDGALVKRRVNERLDQHPNDSSDQRGHNVGCGLAGFPDAVAREYFN